MYTQSALYYDKIYAFKNYQAEVESLVATISKYRHSTGGLLLDVACGSGRHLEYLKDYFAVEGLDINADLLSLARQRCPEVLLYQADMSDFALGKHYDVITCLFSSIGYLKTGELVTKAITCMAQHLVPGGILCIEPWFTPAEWHPNTVHAVYIDEPELKVARINTSYVEGKLSYFDLHYLIGTPLKTEHFVEKHELALYEMEEMHSFIEAAGLEAIYDEQGLTGRGLWVGKS